jgi:hypothetical protein
MAYGRTEAVKILLERGGMDVNKKAAWMWHEGKVILSQKWAVRNLRAV